jgi:hypothetical protein
VSSGQAKPINPGLDPGFNVLRTEGRYDQCIRCGKWYHITENGASLLYCSTCTVWARFNLWSDYNRSFDGFGQVPEFEPNPRDVRRKNRDSRGVAA